MKKILISIVLIVILVAGGITIGVIKTNEAKTPTSTVEMDLNPGASFVVNSNNIVLSVVYTNEDADLIYSDIKVIGRSIEEVARDFTQKAIESGKNIANETLISLDLNTNNFDEDTNCITITINGNKKQAEALQSALVNKVNAVFDQNGIFGRAVADIQTQTTDLANKYGQIAADLKLDVAEFANKTETQILEIINEQAKKFEGLTSTAIDEVEAFINSTVIANIQESINNLETQIQSARAEIAEIQTQLEAMLPQNMKDLYKSQINQFNQNIKKLEAQVKTKLAEINNKVSNKIAELKQTASTRFAELKADLQEKIEAHKTELENFKTAFEADKQARIDAIKAWRESFNTQA